MKYSFPILIIILFVLSNCANRSTAQESNEMKEKLETEGTISLGDINLKYKIEGTGKPCLVIGSSIYYPRTFSTELRENLQMHFVDMRWFAEGPPPPNLKDYTIETITEEIEKVRKELNLEDFLLIGHSIHGTIAMEYAKRYPEHISHLLMIGSPNDFGNKTYTSAFNNLWGKASEERKNIQAAKMSAIQEDLQGMSGAEAMVASYVASSAMYWYNANYDCRWIWEGMPINIEVSNHLFGPLFTDYNMFKDKKVVDLPVLLVLGRYDYVVPYTLWNSDYKQLPKLQIEVFEKSGHTPQLEEPDLFNKKIMAWINE